MRRPSPPRLAPLLALTLVVGILVAMAGEGPTHAERDIVQERLNVPSAMLWQHTVGQTFTARRDGLNGIELMLVRYRPDEALSPEARITLVLERLDAPLQRRDAPIFPVTSTLSCHTTGADGQPRALDHNEIIRFSFSPIADSAGGRFRLTLRTDADHALAFWQTRSEAYAGGEALTDGAPQPGDLYFVTTYAYDVGHALADVGREAARHAPRLPALVLVLFLPGAVAMVWLAPGRATTWELRAALALGASLCFWAIVSLWMSAVGWRITRGSLGIIATALVGVGAYRVYKLGGLPRGEGNPLLSLALGGVLLLTLATRLLHVRDLVVPNWVDSVHHTLITQMICEQGRIPYSCQPYLPMEAFHYHFGFHANAAAFSILSGLAPHEAVLLLGQVINALAPLTAAALAAAISRRRWAGAGAALVVGTLSNMPAYYVSWGRYTQLTGLVILPVTCVALMWLCEGGRCELAAPFLGGLLVAGLGLTHYRVLVFMGTFLLLLPLLGFWQQRGSRAEQVRSLAMLALAGIVSLVLVAPWIARFAQHVFPQVSTLYEGWEATPKNDNVFPVSLLDSGWTRQLFYVTLAGLTWALLRRRGRVLLMALWAGLWLAAANPHLIGLPRLWLIQNPIVAISFWLPAAVVCGWLLGDLSALLTRGLRALLPMLAWDRAISFGLAVTLLVLGAWSAWHTVDIVNAVTTLVTADDVRAIAWAAKHTPPEARFAINTRRWMGTIKSGSDGGWWLPILAHRWVHVPCALYPQVSPAYRAHVDAYATVIEEAESLDDPALIAHLREGGITHVFVGARGGVFMPDKLDGNPHFELLHTEGHCRIYAFTPQNETPDE